MARAVNVLASGSTTIVPADNVRREGILRNLGPNTIWVSSDGPATAAAGVPVYSGEPFAFVLSHGEGLYGIASTADQAADLNTRVEVAAVTG